MKLIIIIFSLVFISFSNVYGQDCLKTAEIIKPVISAEAQKVYEAKYSEAKANFEKNPDADSLIWLGRRTAYLGNYQESIKIFSDGIAKFPKDARFYRHRGHRFLTIRCFDNAVSDFETAAKLVKGKTDEIEPDGMPNARNIPTSTLQSNIFYHLGLAYYLKKDFKNALKAYQKCEKLSKNPDMMIAAKNWLYMTLRRLGKKAEAEKPIVNIGDNLDIIENGDYYKLIKLYQGKLKADDLLTEIGADSNNLSNVSLGYGLGNWFLYNGEKEKAEKIFRQITSGNQWASFGFIAAEAELNN